MIRLLVLFSAGLQHWKIHKSIIQINLTCPDKYWASFCVINFLHRQKEFQKWLHAWFGACFAWCINNSRYIFDVSSQSRLCHLIKDITLPASIQLPPLVNTHMVTYELEWGNLNKTDFGTIYSYRSSLGKY